MARSAFTYSTGSFPASTTSVRVDNLFPVLETALTAVTSNATQAWELYDDIDPALASRDRVYKSVGDRNLGGGNGDVTIFLRLTRVGGQFFIRTYQDWSTLTSTGSRLNTTSAVQMYTGVATYHIFVNEYDLHLIIVDTSTVWFGAVTPVRTHIRSDKNGVMFTTAAATAGSSVVISVDRDATGSIQVGQDVWIQNITAPGDALESETIQVATVEAITATTITLTIGSNVPSGAIIGTDPTPSATFSVLNTSNPNLFFTNLPDTSYPGVNLTTATLTAQSAQISEAETDPQSGINLYIGSRFSVNSTSANFRATRGELGNVAAWSQGAQSDLDTDEMVDVATGTTYRYFYTLLNFSRGLSFEV